MSFKTNTTGRIEVESVGSSAYDTMIFKKQHKFGVLQTENHAINEEDIDNERDSLYGKPLMTQNDKIFGNDESYDTAELNLKLLFHHSGSGSASMNLGRYQKFILPISIIMIC